MVHLPIFVPALAFPRGGPFFFFLMDIMFLCFVLACPLLILRCLEDRLKCLD